jgi:hypothetical protein
MQCCTHKRAANFSWIDQLSPRYPWQFVYTLEYVIYVNCIKLLSKLVSVSFFFFCLMATMTVFFCVFQEQTKSNSWTKSKKWKYKLTLKEQQDINIYTRQLNHKLLTFGQRSKYNDNNVTSVLLYTLTLANTLGLSESCDRCWPVLLHLEKYKFSNLQIYKIKQLWNQILKIVVNHNLLNELLTVWCWIESSR